MDKSVIRIIEGQNLGQLLNQVVSDEEWDTLWDPPPVAEPQDFIGPRAYPPKYLRCKECGDWVRIPDEYRQARKATCLWCANKRLKDVIQQKRNDK